MKKFGIYFAKPFFLSWLAFPLLLAACTSQRSEDQLPGPASKVAKPLSDADECHAFIASLPQDYIHDWITTAEDPQIPLGPKLQIFYYGRISHGVTPILFLNGGPSENSHYSFKSLTDKDHAPAGWSSAPILFMDQRGTGCSSPYPQGDSDEITARLRLYGSSGIIADAEAIRQKLFGSQPWKIFGHSYGGWIVHRYVVAAPESVTSAFSASNVIDPDPIERLTNRIFSQNRVLQEYLWQYSTDVEALTVLNKSLKTGTCFPSDRARPRRCGLAAILPLVEQVGFVRKWPWVHSWLKVLVKNGSMDSSKINDFINKLIFQRASDPLNQKAWPSSVITYYDRGLPEFDRPTCEKIYERLRSRGENPENYLLHECMVSMEFPDDPARRALRQQKFDNLARTFGVNTLTINALSAALAKVPLLGFYLYSGQLDSLVPVENFAPETSALGTRVHYTNFTGSGHETYLYDDVASDILK